MVTRNENIFLAITVDRIEGRPQDDMRAGVNLLVRRQRVVRKGDIFYRVLCVFPGGRGKSGQYIVTYRQEI